MVPLGTKEDVARIVDYQRFYKPKINEFKPGFEYEYVQCSFKQLLTHLPDLDSEGRKPSCIYHQNWTKAIWGAPWSVMKLSNLKELMKKDKVRAKRKLPTTYFKNLLEKQALSFSWRGLHIVVFPKKTIQRDGVEILDNHKMYINGVEQTFINNKPKSKLYNKMLRYKFAEDLDWAFLLGYTNGIQTNQLYQYFEGIFTKDENVFEKIGVNFKTGGLENSPNIPKAHKQKSPRGSYAEHKRQLKETKYEEVDNSMNPAKFKYKSDDELSGHVLEVREIAKVKRIEQTVREEILAAIKEQKNAERIITDDRNRIKMMQKSMVCVQNKETKKTLRVTYHEATKLVSTDNWIFVPKYMWKVDEPTKGKAGEFTGIPRKHKRYTPPRKKPGFKWIQHKKKPVEYETEIHEGEEYYVEQIETTQWPTAEYEYIPVTYGKKHPKAGEPFMIPGYDEDGNKILKQSVKRQLKRIFDVTKNAYVGAKLVKVEKWKRVVKEIPKT